MLYYIKKQEPFKNLFSPFYLLKFFYGYNLNLMNYCKYVIELFNANSPQFFFYYSTKIKFFVIGLKGV